MFIKPNFLTRIKPIVPRMSVFIQKLNPLTGANDWVIQNEDYDFHQEIARSSFADMLHDSERNQKYEIALKSAISQMHSKDKRANVLDIGTGTGLLSMMAVRNGADSVVACEAFAPMSQCALKIIQRNGFQDKIKIVGKRSTDLVVGVDLAGKCNILVTEVFDTELIGEGALSTFKHAHSELLEIDCVVVPHSATIYAQIVECPLIQNWNKIRDVFDDEGKLLVQVPTKVKNCGGSAAVHDLQLSQIDQNLVKTLVSPMPVLRFDWSGKTPFIYERSTINSVKAERKGTAQAVFMWWELQMDQQNKIVLSCAPYWAHPGPAGKKPWRDHWMQAIYYLPQEVHLELGQEVNVISCHDEYSLWFNIKTDLKISDFDYLKPICECGMHVAFSRTRIGQLNDSKRLKKYLKVIENNISNSSVVLVLSHCFYVSLAASKAAKKMYYIESNQLLRRILIDFIEFNDIKNVEVFESFESIPKGDSMQINVVFGEPYFSTSILPWDNLMFTFLLKDMRNSISADVNIFPQKAIIKGIAVNFDDLHKIRLPLGQCEGFEMDDFDRLIQASSSISDETVEAQPLWEYPAIALSKVEEIALINLNTNEESIENCGIFKITKGLGGCNGIALWVDWVFESGSNKILISSGPNLEPEIGQKINWDLHTRQGVYLFANKEVEFINFKFVFSKGNLSFIC